MFENLFAFLFIAAILLFIASRNKKLKPYFASALTWIRAKIDGWRNKKE